jgi:hypothetical protein
LIIQQNIKVLDTLIKNRYNRFRLHYEDYRKLIESNNCDVLDVLTKYGIEHLQEYYENVTLIITDYRLFIKFVLENKNFYIYRE